jgi:signal transduction histidine kinase
LVSPITMRLHQARLQQMTQDTKILSTLVDQLDKISDFEEEAKFNPILENLTS